MRDNDHPTRTVELETMPGFDTAMRRVYAWFENEIIDRPPIRFVAHNAFVEAASEDMAAMTPAERKARWYDAEFQVNLFERSIEGKTFRGETFPVFWPNLGPEVYAGFYGAHLEFGEATSWSTPLVNEWADLDRICLDMDNEYLRKLDELTQLALARCADRYLVGYTDLHPGLDCVAAWRDPQQLCLDMIDHPEQVMRMAALAIADFEAIYDHFDGILKAAGQLSVSWLGIPSFGRMHIPSCDFSSLISPQFFQEFGLPILRREVKTMTHNVFHVDGKRVARNLDAILSVPEVHAVQWVQGVGDDYPIMQWVPLIKDLQARRVPVIVDLSKSEVHQFVEAMDPHGLYLWVATESEDEELALLRLMEQWAVSRRNAVPGRVIEEVPMS